MEYTGTPGEHLDEANAADKIDLWLRTDNPMFGGLAPLYLLSCGQWRIVLDFVREAREANAAAEAAVK